MLKPRHDYVLLTMIDKEQKKEVATASGFLVEKKPEDKYRKATVVAMGPEAHEMDLSPGDVVILFNGVPSTSIKDESDPNSPEYYLIKNSALTLIQK